MILNCGVCTSPADWSLRIGYRFDKDGSGGPVMTVGFCQTHMTKRLKISETPCVAMDCGAPADQGIRLALASRRVPAGPIPLCRKHIEVAMDHDGSLILDA